MKSNDRDVYLSDAYSNLVGLIDVMRLSMLPKPIKTNYPTVDEDGITYYLLDYKRFNNLEETLKIPHLAELASSNAQAGFISTNISTNNIPSSDSDNLIINFNNPNIDKVTFKSQYEIHNFSDSSQGYFGNYNDVIIGGSDGQAIFIEYDFEELVNFDTDKNDNFTNDIKMQIDITGTTAYKYSKNLSAFSQYVPSAIHHGVHEIFPEGIGFDANDKNISYIKQTVIDNEKMIESLSNGYIFNIATTDTNLTLSMDKFGIKNAGNIVYDIKNNTIKNVNIMGSNFLNGTLNANFIKVNRFKTLNYSFNNSREDGMIVGYSATTKLPMIGINRNNTEGYFTSSNVGFRDDDLQSYFSASYFDFNTKIKFFKITELGDLQYNWGSYFQDTRNMYVNSKIEIGNSSELYIDAFAKTEVYGEFNLRNSALTHVSKNIKRINSDNITDGFTVFIIESTVSDKTLIDENLCNVGDEFLLINKSGSTVSICENSNPTVEMFNIDDGAKIFALKVESDSWETI